MLQRSIAKVLQTLQPLSAWRMLDVVGLSCHAKPLQILVEATRVAPMFTHISLPIIRTPNFDGSSLNRNVDVGVGERDALMFVQLDPWNHRDDMILMRNS